MLRFAHIVALTAAVVSSVSGTHLEGIRDEQDDAAWNRCLQRVDGRPQEAQDEDTLFDVQRARAAVPAAKSRSTTVLETMDVERLAADLRLLSTKLLAVHAVRSDDARSAMRRRQHGLVNQYTVQSQASLVSGSSSVQLSCLQPSTAPACGTSPRSLSA